MTANNILLTGLPRAGTTLSCHILNNCPNALALHEPMRPGDFDPSAGVPGAVSLIRDFAEKTRVQVMKEGKAPSQHKAGVVPENPVATEARQGGLRPVDVSLGLIDVSGRSLGSDFNLIIKHNALFTALLPELASAFPTYAIVRNPLAVLASWNLVDLPINNGHIPAAEQFDKLLQRQLAEIVDPLGRQLHILEWFCAHYVEHLPGRWLRYEDFVSEPQVVVNALSLRAPNVAIPMRVSRNAGYDLALMEKLYSRLMECGDAIWLVYPRAQVTELMESIRASQ